MPDSLTSGNVQVNNHKMKKTVLFKRCKMSFPVFLSQNTEQWEKKKHDLKQQKPATANLPEDAHTLLSTKSTF